VKKVGPFKSNFIEIKKHIGLLFLDNRGFYYNKKGEIDG